MSTWTEILETLRGVMAEFMLFLFTVCLVIAAADILIVLTDTEREHATVIAVMYLVTAAGLYTSRFFLDQKEWKGFILTGIVAALALSAAFADIAVEFGISLTETLRGSLAVLIGAIFVTSILYIPRIIYLCGRWRIKRKIRKHSEAGKHREAVKRAEEKSTSPFRHKDFVQNPSALTQSTALALAKSLDAIHRHEDARRVKLAAGGWSNEQAQSFLDERKIISKRNQ